MYSKASEDELSFSDSEEFIELEEDQSGQKKDKKNPLAILKEKILALETNHPNWDKKSKDFKALSVPLIEEAFKSAKDENSLQELFNALLFHPIPLFHFVHDHRTFNFKKNLTKTCVLTIQCYLNQLFNLLEAEGECEWPKDALKFLSEKCEFSQIANLIENMRGIKLFYESLARNDTFRNVWVNYQRISAQKPYSISYVFAMQNIHLLQSSLTTDDDLLNPLCFILCAVYKEKLKNISENINKKLQYPTFAAIGYALLNIDRKEDVERFYQYLKQGEFDFLREKQNKYDCWSLLEQKIRWK